MDSSSSVADVPLQTTRALRKSLADPVLRRAARLLIDQQPDRHAGYL
jgi:hypothetical protein